MRWPVAYLAVSPVDHLLQREIGPWDGRRLPPYWQAQAEHDQPERENDVAASPDVGWLFGWWLLPRCYSIARCHGCCRRRAPRFCRTVIRRLLKRHGDTDGRSIDILLRADTLLSARATNPLAFPVQFKASAARGDKAVANFRRHKNDKRTGAQHPPRLPCCFGFTWGQGSIAGISACICIISPRIHVPCFPSFRQCETSLSATNGLVFLAFRLCSSQV